MSACRCHARILRVLTGYGRRLDVDAEPNPAGTVAIVRTTGAGEFHAMILGPADVVKDDDGIRYMIHECPAREP